MNADSLDSETFSFWEKAKNFFLLTFSSQEEKDEADRYLGLIISVSLSENVFTIYTSSEYAAELIRDKYMNRLKGAFMMAGAPSYEIDVQVSKERVHIITPTIKNTQSIDPSLSSFEKKEDFVSTLPLNEDYTFASFVRGPSNSYAFAAAEGVVNSPARAGYNPLFIYGGTGLGKTHLMHAIGNELRRRNPSLKICYITSETFLNEYVNHLRSGRLNQFRDRYRSIDMLLIDDIQFFAQKTECQTEFFNTFNALKDGLKQIVMTSDVAPKDIPSIEERLISRFEGGMVQEVESPSYETRLAILKKKNEINDFGIPSNVLEYIADKIKSHVRAMEGALTRVSLTIKAEPNLVLRNDMLDYILKDYIEKERTMRKLSIEEIQQACAQKYGVSMNDIFSHERLQSIVTPRQMAMYISRKLTCKGLKEIAASFKKKHATVINGVKTITERLSNEPELKADLESIINSFGYKLSDITD